MLRSRSPGGSEGSVPLEFQTESEGLPIAGFWMFLVTDLLIFASLFSVYAVYHFRTAGGPTEADIFHLGSATAETLILLTSSFTVSLAIWFMRRDAWRPLHLALAVTVLLGAVFVGIEIREFAADLAGGAAWTQSAFLSSFFVLVATHGTHVAIGILWALALWLQAMWRGLTPVVRRKLFTFALYWHFLDIVWVFIFTYVYLAGRMG